MAASANALITRRGNDLADYKAAAVHHYQGALAFINASGYCDVAIASGVNKFAGVVKDEVDNSAGNAGDLNVECHVEGCFLLTGSGFTIADERKDVFASDSNTITLTGSGTVVRIGTVAKYHSATKIWVRLDLDAGQRAAALTAADATTLNTGHAPSDTVITTMRTRQGEIEAVLKAKGLLT